MLQLTEQVQASRFPDVLHIPLRLHRVCHQNCHESVQEISSTRIFGEQCFRVRTDSMMRDCCVRRSAADRMGQRGLREEVLCAKPVRCDLVGLLVSFRAAGTACAIMST